MGIQHGYHVGQTIAVDVVHPHHAATEKIAAVSAERLGMELPGLVAAAWGRLLKPSVGMPGLIGPSIGYITSS